MKNPGTQNIKTARLLLRRLRPEDAAALLTSGSLSGTPEEAAKNVEKRILDYDSPHCYHWVIDLAGRPIGRILAWEVSTRDEYCQLGYDMAPDCRCRGYMTEALSAVLRYLLTEADFNRVYCSVRVPNAASNAVCKKSGMTLDGILRQHYKSPTGYDDVNVWSMIKDDLSL